VYKLEHSSQIQPTCTMGTGSFPGVKSGRGVTLAPHPFQCRGHERVELYLYSPYGPYSLYRASVHVQGYTFFFYWHYNPLWGLAFSLTPFHSALSLHWFLHRLIPIICISSTISTIHLILVLPQILVPIGFHSNILLGVLSSSIRITWPSQAILLLFINLTIFAFSIKCALYLTLYSLLPSSCQSIRPPLCLSACNMSSPTGRISVEFDIWE